MKQPLALFQGFLFILLLHSTQKVPSSALHSACLLPLPQDFYLYSFSTLPSLLFVKMKATERTEWFQGGTIRRRQSQDMSWGHLWYSTWNQAEVVPAEGRGGPSWAQRAPPGSGQREGAKHSFHFTWQFCSGQPLQRLTQVFVSLTQALPMSRWNLSGWYWRVTEDESNFCQKRQRGNF